MNHHPPTDPPRSPDFIPDHYLPRSGNSGYAVLHYDLDLTCTLGSNRLDGSAWITAVATVDLDGLSLDLFALGASRCLLNGSKVRRFTQTRDKLVLHFSAPVRAGEKFSLEIHYAGIPQLRSGPGGDVGWEELSDGVLLVGQPNGAACWFPCNDHPSQKATYRFVVSTDSGYRPVCNGRLTGHHRGLRRDQWIYEVIEPMASYLATLQIGRYELHPLTVAQPACGQPADSRTPVPQLVAVASGRLARARSALSDQPRMMQAFIKAFGPYPFEDYTVVVTEDNLEIPLEAHGISILGKNHLDRRWRGQRMIAHELAHQWFGNSLTIGRWGDIWLHEGFASYAEWIWSEASGSHSAHHRAKKAWKRLKASDQDIAIGDPGPEEMFDDRVYVRGALALHALRLVAGDRDFFAMLKSWTVAHRHENVTGAQFTAHVQDRLELHMPAEDFLRPWLFECALPALPPNTMH
ncbi:MAG: M1 family metallopeptidase [Micrococcaceae bacterium]|nr:M1 family metallopeptidase [Micrococcaceae bacterium]